MVVSCQVLKPDMKQPGRHHTGPEHTGPHQGARPCPTAPPPWKIRQAHFPMSHRQVSRRAHSSLSITTKQMTEHQVRLWISAQSTRRTPQQATGRTRHPDHHSCGYNPWKATNLTVQNLPVTFFCNRTQIIIRVDCDRHPDCFKQGQI